MPRVQIFGMARSTVCRGKKKCAVVSNLDRLRPVYSQEVDDNHDDKKSITFQTSNDVEPYRTIGDFNPITKEWS
jgi:hypothetical protein